MAYRTVLLRGSPRRGGNSDTLADAFVDEVQIRGGEVMDVALSDLSYQGCINLFHCKTGGVRCGQVDDLTPVLAAIETAEVLVLASPVYFTSISGQLKLVIDRFFSFFVPDYVTNPEKSRLGHGRHLVFLQTQGEPQERYADLLDSFAASFDGLGFDQRYLVRAWNVRDPDDVAQQSEYRSHCAEVADLIYG